MTYADTDAPLFPVARRSDPDTSHEAASTVGDVRETQRAVYALLDGVGPMTDEELVVAYGNGPPMQSPQGLRSRRAELVRLGHVRWRGDYRMMRTGRRARVWQAVPQ